MDKRGLGDRLDELNEAFGTMSMMNLAAVTHSASYENECKDDVDLERLIEEDMLDNHDRMVHIGSPHFHDVSSERASPIGSHLHDISAASSERASPVIYEQLDTRTSSTKPVDIKGHEVSSIPKSMSLPLNQLTPNPFPELQGSPVSLSASSLGGTNEASKSSPSSPLLRVGERNQRRQSNPPATPPRISTLTSPEEEESLWRPQSYNKMMLNVYIDQQNYKTVSIDAAMTTCDLCHLLVLKNHTTEDKNWTIVEHLAKYNLERSLEDDEQVLSAHSSWNNMLDNRFYFRKDFRKYAMFHNPTQFFPLQMMNIRETSCWDLLDRVERHKNLLLKNLFSSGEQLPDINGFLHFKEGKKSWKKAYFVLRRSGLYYSSKGLSKDPKHLVLYADITENLVYLTNNAKKTFGAPSQYGFCLKQADRSGNDIKDFKILCADDEQSRMCWISGLRLTKYGSQLTSNYKAAIKREGKLRNMENTQLLSHSDEDIYVKSRVAMDFTGMKGRVVDDPMEAIGVAIAEGHTWRKKAAVGVTVVRSPLSQSPTNTPTADYQYHHLNPAYLSQVPMQIHFTQPWFHNGIHREEAVQLITSHGLVDGVFLVRTSHKVPGTFVLSLAHNQKVKHCQIIKVIEDGVQFYSLDGGYTKFTDLLQLVEFYQVNPAGLPTRLKHYVTRLI